MDKETLNAIDAFGDELEDRLIKVKWLVENLPDNAMAVDPEMVHDLFRQLHSLKSAANLLSLKPIGDIAHKLEDALSKVRTGEIVVDQPFRNLLQAGINRIEELGENLRKVRIVDVSRELAALDRLIKERTRHL